MIDEAIKTLMEKSSNYDFLNNIIPGAIFCCVYEKLSGHTLLDGSCFTNLVIIYFSGILMSRIGLLVIEPLSRCKIFHFGPIAQYSKYEDFIKAEKLDPKLKLLVARNNMYRTFVSTMFVLLGYKILSLLTYKVSWLSWMKNYKIELVAFAIFELFLFSFRKQTKYIRTRVENAIREK